MSFSPGNATCPRCVRPLSPGTTYCPSCGAFVSYGTNDPTIPPKYPYLPTNYGGVKNPYETEAPIPPPPPPPKRRRVWLWTAILSGVFITLAIAFDGVFFNPTHSGWVDTVNGLLWSIVFVCIILFISFSLNVLIRKIANKLRSN